MRTPKEYTQNLKQKIITKQMLADCLYSVNKRAKNCRDNEHKYEEGYGEILKSGNYINNSGFYDPDRREHVEFVVQMIPDTVYYLTYTVSNRTFRVPLAEAEIEKYPDLEIVDVGRITPVYGDITADMLSVQFVEKVLKLVKSGNYTLQLEE